MKFLYNDDLKRLAPSVFALEPWQAQSDKYRFIPTIKVIDALRDAHFFPVKAMQSRTRTPGKADFTKHMIRFRAFDTKTYQVNDIIPEIVLVNSHDGTSAYKLMAGLFRLVCTNGLVVADGEIQSIRFRHTGRLDLCQEVINTSATVIHEAGHAIETANRWEKLILSRDDQIAYAKDALKANQSSIEVMPERLLSPNRREDAPDAETGRRDLWRTFNTVQENIIKGRLIGRNSKGRITHVREVKSVDRNVGINRELWTLAEAMAALKTQN